MRTMWAIAKRFILGIVKAKSNLIFMVITPIIFTCVFGVLPNASANAPTPIGVVDLDGTPISAALMSRLKETPDVTIQPMSNNDTTSALRHMKVSMIVTIPRGFEQGIIGGQAPSITMTQAPNQGGNIQSTMAVQQTIEDETQVWQVAGQVALMKATQQGSVQDKERTFLAGAKDSQQIKPLVQTSADMIHDGKTVAIMKPNQQAVIGFATMFIMLIVFGRTSGIIGEKKLGTWARMKCSPASKWSILAGYSLGFFLIGWLQFAIMYFAGRWIFGIPIPMNGWVVLTVSLYVLAACGIALCAVGLVKTVEQHNAIGVFTTIATSMIGGAYWPKDIEPVWMQHVAWFVPQNWAIESFRMITVGDVGGMSFFWPLIVLAGFAVVFFSAGLVQLRHS